MLKKIISLLLCCTMCMPLFCIADETAATTDKTVYTLTLTDAIKMALEDNDQLAVCDYQKESYKYGLEAAKITKKNNKNREIYASSGYELGYIQEGYYIDMYQTQLKLADHNKEKVTANITYNVTEAYYNYKHVQQLVEITRSSCEMAKANKANVDVMSNLGMISPIEVQNAQLAVDSASNALKSLERNLETVKESFKIVLDIEEDCDFVLTSPIDTQEFTADFAADVENAMTTRYDVLSLKENLRLAESRCKLTERLATKHTAAYYNELSSYMQTKYTAENSLKQIKLLVKSSYDAVLTAKDNLDIAQQNANIKQTLYDAAKLKFEMGMITNIDLTKDLNDLTAAKEDLENAKLTYKLAVEKYNYDITIGL